ncbi:MAG: methionine--tRNA ligase [Gemmataceae bacterium]
MAAKFYVTTAIDYPNSRPHIGTAFEKIGADVQARYRRMEGYEVFFLMGNDENTVKVARRAAELGMEPKAYCDWMAAEFQRVWQALEISYDAFIQTSDPRHHRGCQEFIQRVYDRGYIYNGTYQGWYCEGCESFKTETEIREAGGVCPLHKTPPTRRQEPCYFFALSRFQQALLDFYEGHPEFIQPEARRNEIVSLVRSGLQDVNITRTDQTWGIRVPFDARFTIYVWFDALLNYITGIGYGSRQDVFEYWWPADIHFIGKDITRFHCALWPAMLMAAGLDMPRQVFGHGFVYIKNEQTGTVDKISKSLGNVVEPMEIITRFSAEAFRYYFLRECPFPGDGEFSWSRFADVYNADLANNLGNLYSRVVTLVLRHFEGHLAVPTDAAPGTLFAEDDLESAVLQTQRHLERCEYHLALQTIWQKVLDPANRYADRTEPWRLVKTAPQQAQQVLLDLVGALRAASILLKPFLPTTAAKIYNSFDFPQVWEQVRYEDAYAYLRPPRAVRVRAVGDASGRLAPLFPRIVVGSASSA